MVEVRPESIAEIVASRESSELLEEYADECSIPLIGEISPQPQIYAALEQSGVLRCFGAFDRGKLVGFVTVLLTVLPHYGKKVATVESLFARRGGSELIEAAELCAKYAGCTAILYSAPAGGRLEKLLSMKKSCKRTNAIFCRSIN